MKVSFVIPVVNNFKYTKYVYDNLRKYYPNDEVVISDGGSTDETIDYFSNIEDNNLTLLNNGSCNLAKNYNIAVENSTSEVIILLHNDMFVPPNFKDKILKDLTPNNIVTYTRIEPPIFPGESSGKLVRNFGNDINELKQEEFIKFAENYNIKTDGGGQLFFACYKNNYLKLDEVTYHPPQMWCSDDDIHLRFILKGLDKVVSSACVYHFVSKTSRTGEYKEGEIISNKNFLRKWGFRKSNYNVVYNKKFISNVVLDDETREVLGCFFNGGEDIIVELNNNFNDDDYSYIQQLNDIVKQTNDTGTFELGNLTITVNSLAEQQNKYIIL
jgi:glycosyltransferase involved in cell wall biosynthesis